MKNEPEIVKILRSEEKESRLKKNNKKNNSQDLCHNNKQLNGNIFLDLEKPDSKERYEKIFQLSPETIIVIDRQGNVLDINKSIHRWLGYKPEDLVGINIFNLPFLPEESKNIAKNNFNQILDGVDVKPFEMKFISDNGHEKIGRILDTPIKNSEGVISGDVIIISDITESKSSEEAIKRSLDFEKTVSIISSQFISNSDINDAIKNSLSEMGDFSKASRVYLFRISDNGEVLNNTHEWCAERVLPQLDYFQGISADCCPWLMKKLRKGEVIHIEDVEKLPEEAFAEKNTFVKRCVKSALIFPLKISDKLNGFIGLDNIVSTGKWGDEDFALLRVCSEITGNALERKQAEEELQKTLNRLRSINSELQDARKELTVLNKDLEKKVRERTYEIHRLLKQKDEFIGQLGHDLKNPLTPIVNLLPTVIERPNDPKNKERLDKILRNVSFIHNLVNDTLKLARLNSKNIKIDAYDLNLYDLIEDVVNDNQLLFDQKDIKVKNIENKNIFIKSDQMQMKEIFNNLVSNAFKFMDNKGSLIFNAEYDINKKYIVISVKDTGIGLTKKQINHIFDEFYKADPSRHDLDSSGLGLAICKRIVERHGGKIWVDSPGIGKGTTFYFTIPAGSDSNAL